MWSASFYFYCFCFYFLSFPLFNRRDHIDTFLMPAALKLCIQPLLYDHLRKLNADDSCAKSKNVGIIVLF